MRFRDLLVGFLLGVGFGVTLAGYLAKRNLQSWGDIVVMGVLIAAPFVTISLPSWKNRSGS